MSLCQTGSLGYEEAISREAGGLEMDKTEKKFHINFWYIIAAVLGMLLIQDLYLASTRLTPIPYSRFQTLLNEDKVAKIEIAQNYISGSLKQAQPDGVKDFV